MSDFYLPPNKYYKTFQIHIPESGEYAKLYLHPFDPKAPIEEFQVHLKEFFYKLGTRFHWYFYKNSMSEVKGVTFREIAEKVAEQGNLKPLPPEYSFYLNINCADLIQQEIAINERQSVSINQFGVTWNESQFSRPSIITDQQCFADFYYRGPLYPIVDNGILDNILLTIESLFDKEKMPSRSNSFPRIKYEALGDTFFEFDISSDRSSGNYVELKAGHLKIGGWDAPFEKGFQVFAVERYLSCPYIPKKIPFKERKPLSELIRESVYFNIVPED